MAAMMREQRGGPCEFMRQPLSDDNRPVLCPLAFASRRCKGYETRLHSYSGEGFAGDWGLHKFEHYWWGSRSTWITDSHAIRFILTYNGTNGPLCRLQMRIMMIHCDIEHRNAEWLADADYGSRHGGDMWYDPLLMEHDACAALLRKRHAPPMGPLLL